MNMKKIAALFLTGALSAVLLLSGCNAQPTGTNDTAADADTSWTDIQSKGKFVVGLDASFAPMGYTDESGEIVGFDIDLAREVAKKMNVEVEFKPIDWNAKSMELSGKKIDVIWNGFSISEERKQEVLFTDPYLTTEQVLIVKAGSPIQTKADLAGKKIALQDGSTSETALKADAATYNSIGDDNISRFKENTEVIMELESGRVDAAIIDEVFVSYYLAKEKMTDKFEVLDESFGAEDYGIGARKSDKAFVEQLNQALAACKSEGITSEISQKWFGKDIIK